MERGLEGRELGKFCARWACLMGPGNELLWVEFLAWARGHCLSGRLVGASAQCDLGYEIQGPLVAGQGSLTGVYRSFRGLE